MRRARSWEVTWRRLNLVDELGADVLCDFDDDVGQVVFKLPAAVVTDPGVKVARLHTDGLLGKDDEAADERASVIHERVVLFLETADLVGGVRSDGSQ